MPMWYWFFHVVCTILRFIVHCALAFRYWGKGKTVPRVKNPLLLKSAAKLAEEIREGKIKSEAVIRAYTERIVEVEPYINATVDRCFSAALEEAKEVDELIASGRHSKKQLAEKKPLLGVPISIKVLLIVKGLRCTAGSLLFENLRAAEDSPSVALLKKAGAIIIATTNSAEMGMDFETNNILHGKTCNPFDTSKTSGGSSGGESALVAASGSVLGLGNDLLGSIRVPCHFTGLFGHKPSVGLVPNLGCHPTPDPRTVPYLSSGPMCRYAEDLIISMRILSSQSGIPVNFGQKVDFKNIKIYYMKEIRTPMMAPVDSDIALALKSAVSYFTKNYNLETKEVKMDCLYDANRAVTNLILSRTKDMKATLTAGKETFIDEKLEMVKFLFGKSILSKGPLVTLNGSKIKLFVDRSRTPYYEKMVKSWEVEFDSFLDENSVLLMPTLPIPAPYHDEMTLFLPSTCYTSIFNVLGFPSTQCPLGYNSNGMPYGIQIVGCKNNDALTIACAVELEKAFGGWKEPRI
ncbi:fatty-acid amide hydrolase 2-A [Trichonephila clavata]|uniref:Fatty-acid amide hydrolase 2-A n=1 Tax=Trichonephila clavata TaxID=2740835 RepID=A0A8X6GM87_TRICU|nr:fatty-acid amide hydrolase 2-A [Trichonephila clavata]